MARSVIADIETDGLLPELTRIHCIGAIDIATGEEFLFPPGRVEEGLRFLATECAYIIGHNFKLFDMKAIAKVYPEWAIKIEAAADIIDTLPATKMVWPRDRLWAMDTKLIERGKLKPEMRVRYSLEAFGIRLGELKGDFGKTSDWSAYTPQMGAYMMQDCRVNMALWRRIREKWPKTPLDAFILETEQAEICETQQKVGVWFDRESAVRLLGELQNEMAAITVKLREHFPPWPSPEWIVEGGNKKGQARRVVPRVVTIPATRKVKDPLATHTVTIARISPTTGKALKPYVGPPIIHYEKGAQYSPVVFKTFNPSSRDDIADRLQKLFGWKPTEFTDEGKPKVDETVLTGIKHLPPVPDLLRYFVLAKIAGFIEGGKESWLRHYKEKTKRIHGRCDPLGTITGRAAHSKPNLGQVPKVLAVSE